MQLQERSVIHLDPTSRVAIIRLTSVCLPFFVSSITTLMLAPSRDALRTFVDNLNFKPCLVSDRCKVLATSRSIPTPPMLDRNSTHVTSAPSRDQTDPSSTPITPAPIRINFSGTFFSDRAPVDDTIVSSSHWVYHNTQPYNI